MEGGEGGGREAGEKRDHDSSYVPEVEVVLRAILFTERKGLVILQPSSCHQGRNLL